MKENKMGGTRSTFRQRISASLEIKNMHDVKNRVFRKKREKDYFSKICFYVGLILHNSVLKWPYRIHDDALHELRNVTPEGYLAA
jgi:hypothetical protein